MPSLGTGADYQTWDSFVGTNGKQVKASNDGTLYLTDPAFYAGYPFLYTGGGEATPQSPVSSGVYAQGSFLAVELQESDTSPSMSVEVDFTQLIHPVQVDVQQCLASDGVNGNNIQIFIVFAITFGDGSSFSSAPVASLHVYGSDGINNFDHLEQIVLGTVVDNTHTFLVESNTDTATSTVTWKLTDLTTATEIQAGTLGVPTTISSFGTPTAVVYGTVGRVGTVVTRGPYSSYEQPRIRNFQLSSGLSGFHTVFPAREAPLYEPMGGHWMNDPDATWNTVPGHASGTGVTYATLRKKCKGLEVKLSDTVTAAEIVGDDDVSYAGVCSSGIYVSLDGTPPTLHAFPTPVTDPTVYVKLVVTDTDIVGYVGGVLRQSYAAVFHPGRRIRLTSQTLAHG